MPERFNQTLMNMLGTLEDDQKRNWRAFVPALVHAYNSTRHESTGLSPHFLMFGRHPRLAVDAFLGLEPDVVVHKDHTNYVTGLKKRLDFAYKVATREARKQSNRHKRLYDLRVRNVKLEPGDRVLIRNVGVRGKCKLADKWQKEVFLVVDQPHDHIPVFRVKREFGRGGLKTLHRNHLLPFMALPSKQISDTSLPTPDSQVDTPPLDSTPADLGSPSRMSQSNGQSTERSSRTDKRSSRTDKHTSRTDTPSPTFDASEGADGESLPTPADPSDHTPQVTDTPCTENSSQPTPRHLGPLVDPSGTPVRPKRERRKPRWMNPEWDCG